MFGIENHHIHLSTRCFCCFFAVIRIVQLGEFGNFRITVDSEGMDVLGCKE